jgi:hypothetical protein
MSSRKLTSDLTVTTLLGLCRTLPLRAGDSRRRFFVGGSGIALSEEKLDWLANSGKEAFIESASSGL